MNGAQRQEAVQRRGSQVDLDAAQHGQLPCAAMSRN
jgi:hypothetical protein